MNPHRRREFAATNRFSSPNPIHSPDRSGEIEFITRATGIEPKYACFGRTDDHKSGATARRTLRSYDNHSDGDEEFRWLVKEEDGDDSDVSSPRMWEHPGSPTTRSAQASPVLDRSNHHYRATPRAQVIARYRQEMMDLVRGVPEHAYELSLKDIVELPRMVRSAPETPVNGTERGKQQKSAKKKGVRRVSRSESMDTGVFLLKMFPFSLTGWRRRRSSGSSDGTCSKVSPKPISTDRRKSGPEKSADGEWWDKNEYGDMSSSSGSGSSNSSNSSINSRIRKMKAAGCYSFILNHKSKARVNMNEGDAAEGKSYE